MKKLQKLLQAYQELALILLNTFVFLAILNIGLWGIFQIQESFSFTSNPVSRKYGNPKLKKVYPDLSEEAMEKLLNETWSRKYIYEAFTQFKERPYSGTYVNVSLNGFRITKNQGAWPPNRNNFNIFIFGGSTTFGYGVKDEQTVASYLQEFLSNKLERNVKVYNFGRGNYYSTQELILLQRLLVSGFIPDVAVFVDGLNDFYYYNDRPLYTKRFQSFVDAEGKKESLELSLLKKLPMTKLAKFLKDRVSTNLTNKEKEKEKDFDEDIYNDKSLIDNIVNRYLNNKKLIEAVTAAYNVSPVFVWQPVPTYKYNLNYHLFAGNHFGKHSYSKYGYQYMAKLIEEKPLGDNFLWLADIQEKLQEPLYVDKVHYSAKMNEMLALNIANLLLESNLLMKDKKTIVDSALIKQ
ncbi:SGNH/GDSL hydrolase family protein [Dapis sp. BLCC M126]|uniref:SGNH/GDSL hydrolase family protein n=1 Tax=Dapis sp. BLCC M126 TaxID=3400189 RepID=UPI003CE9D72E